MSKKITTTIGINTDPKAWFYNCLLPLLIMIPIGIGFFYLVSWILP